MRLGASSMAVKPSNKGPGAKAKNSKKRKKDVAEQHAQGQEANAGGSAANPFFSGFRKSVGNFAEG